MKYLSIIAASEEEQMAKAIENFGKRVDKRRAKGEQVIFDPDVVRNDMERWFYQKKLGTPGVHKSIDQYKTHEDLHRAMQNFKSLREIQLDKQTGEHEVEGKELLFSIGEYKVFKVTTVKALTMLADGSNWCVQYPAAAQDYLVNKKSTFYIVLRGTQRYVAIRETAENKPNVEVWWYTDYELRNGTSYADFTADLMQADIEIINQILLKLGFNSIHPGKTFKVYSNIETYLEKMRETGQFKRFFYNQRFYPELANELFTPGKQIRGDLDLSGTGITTLPEGLKVGGGLFLSGTGITTLPEGLKVGGDLYLSATPITSLPKGLKVGRSLNLSGTGITSLPKGLKVGRSLNLSGTGITSLPEGLSVGGDLNLQETNITSLPKGLSVGGDLYLSGTNITSLPEGLKVGGGLFLSGTPITSLPEGLSVGGDLDLRETPITTLPEGLSVGGDLYLSETPITSLPEWLKVPGDLFLRGTAITSLPEGLSVGGSLFLNETQITSLPEGLSVGRVLYGTNPTTGKSYQQEYDEMKSRQKKSSSLRKLKVTPVKK